MEKVALIYSTKNGNIGSFMWRNPLQITKAPIAKIWRVLKSKAIAALEKYVSVSTFADDPYPIFGYVPNRNYLWSQEPTYLTSCFCCLTILQKFLCDFNETLEHELHDAIFMAKNNSKDPSEAVDEFKTFELLMFDE